MAVATLVSSLNAAGESRGSRSKGIHRVDLGPCRGLRLSEFFPRGRWVFVHYWGRTDSLSSRGMSFLLIRPRMFGSVACSLLEQRVTSVRFHTLLYHSDHKAWMVSQRFNEHSTAPHRNTPRARAYVDDIYFTCICIPSRAPVR